MPSTPQLLRLASTCRPAWSLTLTRGLKKPKYDRSKLPTIHEADLYEHFISGTGPGGQKVNKSQNCVYLKHIPSGLAVKVHEKRGLAENRQLARELLVSKLDDQINGENSLNNQKKRYRLQSIELRKAQQEHKHQLKENFKRSLGHQIPAEDVDREPQS